MAFSPPYISFYSEHLMCMRAKLLQCCPNLCDPKDCSLPGSSAYGILLTRILEWVAKTSSSWMLWDPMLQDTALEANWHQVKFQLNHFLLWSLETFLNFSKLQFQKKKRQFENINNYFIGLYWEMKWCSWRAWFQAWHIVQTRVHLCSQMPRPKKVTV